MSFGLGACIALLHFTAFVSAGSAVLPSRKTLKLPDGERYELHGAGETDRLTHRLAQRACEDAGMELSTYNATHGNSVDAYDQLCRDTRMCWTADAPRSGAACGARHKDGSLGWRDCLESHAFICRSVPTTPQPSTFTADDGATIYTLHIFDAALPHADAVDACSDAGGALTHLDPASAPHDAVALDALCGGASPRVCWVAGTAHKGMCAARSADGGKGKQHCAQLEAFVCRSTPAAPPMPLARWASPPPPPAPPPPSPPSPPLRPPLPPPRAAAALVAPGGQILQPLGAATVRAIRARNRIRRLLIRKSGPQAQQAVL